jgi:hypothetical protein
MKNVIRSLIELASLLLSALLYKMSGRTPVRGYFALLRLHALSNGRITECLARFVRGNGNDVKSITIEPDAVDSLIIPIKPEEMRQLLDTLDVDGYAVYPHRLSPATCERLRGFCREIAGVEWHHEGRTKNRSTYNGRTINTGKLQLDTQDLTDNIDVQALMADTTLLQLAQKNLGATPILDSVMAWWSFATTGKPSSAIAQMYHYDMERIQWLKVFIYLSDVTPSNGPHVYVQGSHKPEACRESLLARGYVRIPDEEIEEAYGKNRIIEVSAPEGTILLGNTIAYHKGKPPEEGERLIFELQFTNSLFGACLGKIRLKNGSYSKLTKMRRKYPYIFQQVV